MTLRSYQAAIAAVFLALPCAAAVPAYAADAPVPAVLPAPPEGKGQVVFYRKPLFSLVPFNWIARENKVEICEMVAGTYCVAAVDPGTHTYEVHSEVTNKLTLEVDAGETYYVLGGIAMGLIVNHPTITPTPKKDFDLLSPKLKPKAAILAAAPAPESPAAAAVTPVAAPAAETPVPAAPAASSTPPAT